MPAVSKKQAVAMNIAKAVQQGQATAKPGSPSAQIAGSMAPADVNEFAGTPQKGLPMSAPKPPGSKEKQQDVVGGQAKPWGWEAPHKKPQVVSKNITRMPFKKR